MKIKAIVISTFLAIASIFSFNSLFYRAPLFESGIYYGFLQSFLQDHDLNLVNNVDPKLQWILSPTMNVPVMHDHGSILAWAPLGYFANKADEAGKWQLQSSRGPESFLLYSIMLSTLILILGAMLILNSVVQPASRVEKFFFWSFPLTTPLLYYGFFEFVSADVVMFFWACCVLYFGKTSKFATTRDHFYWGLLLGLGRVVKISSLFWLPYFLYELLRTKSTPSRLKRFCLFGLGFLVPLLGKWINDYREFGFLTWNNGYGYDFEFPRPALFASLYQNLFGNFGVFFIGFWLVVGLFFFVLNQKQIARRNIDKRWLWSVLAIVIVAKFGYECLLVSDNETEFGFRRYLVDVPFITWMVVEFFRTGSVRSKIWRQLGFALLGLNFIWSTYYLFWYLDVDQHYYGALGVYRSWQFGQPGRELLDLLHELVKAYLSPLQWGLGLCVLVLSFFAIQLKQRFWKPDWNLSLIPALVGLYFVITVLNFYENPRNVEVFKSRGMLDSQVISNNLSTLLYDEILSELGRNILISKYLGDRDRFDQSVTMLQGYIAGIPSTLLRDPIHFGDDLRAGKLRKIYYDAEMDMQSLTDFKAPSYYDKTMGPYLGLHR